MSRKFVSLALLVLVFFALGALPAAAQEPVIVRWFVGLGSGGNPEQIEAQNAVVAAFNASHTDIQIEIIIANNDVAYDTLSTLIASGDSPDIVGPVGIRGSNAFTGSWLDLQPLVDASGYDLSQFPQALVDFYRVEGEGLIGLPFGVFPSFIWFNRDLFDEAGLDYPPQVFGEPYADGRPWDIDTLTDLSKQLTVDANGADATSADFDPEAIEQFGFVFQYTDPRGQGSMFGPGSFVGPDNTAVVPDAWLAAWQWYYDVMWTSYFAPNDNYVTSDLLANGNPFASGRVAMAQTHLWYLCCVGEVDNFDFAVNPSYNGVTTAKLHADTFRILKSSANPEAAFEVLTYLIGEASQPLLAVYGGMPALPDLQADYFAGLDANYPQGVNWQVAIDSANYGDNPSHEGNMPNFNQADARIGAFQTLYQGTPGLDIVAEIEKLRVDLQAIFQGTYVAPDATPAP